MSNIKIKIRLFIDNLNLTLNTLQNRYFKRNLTVHQTSHPYLCPDTYFAISDFQIFNKDSLKNFFQEIEKLGNKNIYIISSLVNEFILEIQSRNISMRFNHLIIGQDDVIITETLLRPIQRNFRKIFASNLMQNQNSVIPIPLGLERRAYRSAGVLKHFKKEFTIDPEKRGITFIVCWNDKTNINREKVREIFRLSNSSLVIDKRITPSALHFLYRNSLFVPSPAGNGLDCHRTWEAFYLGAVPVVLKSEYTGDESWPVLVIDSWERFVRLEPRVLRDLYKKYAKTREQSIAFSINLLEKLKYKI